ncbi:MAG: hypothetical protein OGMRLDGQ_000939 [Candidatus Fervidibacter sp.]|jgi:hypothetical protein
MSAGVKACSGKFWRAHLLMCRKFSAAQERCPPEKPFAIRYLPFAVVLARQKYCSPILSTD